MVFLIPQVIQLARKKHLFDKPDEKRKIHVKPIPNLGGIAIFTGFLFSALLYVPDSLLSEVRILLAAGVIIFMVGLKDDLMGLSARVKLVAQVVASGLVSILTDLRVKEIYCFGGSMYFEYSTSIFLTVVFITGLVNAYNLIDGIDGLAGSLGILFSITYGVFFYNMGATDWAILASSLVGVLVGFLIFNITPAKIFMGDSGSLLLGFMAAIFSLKFLGLRPVNKPSAIYIPLGLAFPIVISVVIVPVFDTIRVFTIRILNGKSPFQADRNHLHHLLLDTGLAPIRASMMLTGINFLFIVIAATFGSQDSAVLVPLLFLIPILLTGLLNVCSYMMKKKVTC